MLGLRFQQIPKVSSPPKWTQLSANVVLTYFMTQLTRSQVDSSVGSNWPVQTRLHLTIFSWYFSLRPQEWVWAGVSIQTITLTPFNLAQAITYCTSCGEQVPPILPNQLNSGSVGIQKGKLSWSMICQCRMFILLKSSAFIVFFIAETGRKCLDESIISPLHLNSGLSSITIGIPYIVKLPSYWGANSCEKVSNPLRNPMQQSAFNYHLPDYLKMREYFQAVVSVGRVVLLLATVMVRVISAEGDGWHLKTSVRQKFMCCWRYQFMREFGVYFIQQGETVSCFAEGLYCRLIGCGQIPGSDDASTTSKTKATILVIIFRINNNSLMQQREQLQCQHRRQVKTAFTNYSKDMKEEYSYLFSNITTNEFYLRNQERKAFMLQNALKHNQKFLDQILEFVNYSDQEQYQPLQETKGNNRSKIKTTLKQFYREWCEESQQKKDYKKMAQKCKEYLKKGDRVLVPGCGMGRLVFDLVMAGFGAQGNQLTYFMLFGSNFIINVSEKKSQFTIYPFIHSTAYYYEEEDMFRSVTIPDEAPSQELQGQPDFSIVGGEFTFLYNQQPDTFSGVASCFFLDTANNIFEYVDTIWTTLKPEGIWVNFGPLLFHYKEMLNQVSIQISWQTLRAYIALKFQLIEQYFSNTTYCHDPRSDLSVQYNCINFVARKKTSVP